MPENLARAVLDSRVERLDVRPLLQAGGEPLGSILEVTRRLGAGDALLLTTPFEPVPLYNVLGKKGFSYWPVPRAEGVEIWETYFYRDGDGDGEEAEEVPEGKGFSGEGAIRVLDVRGLEPPEPLERVLEATESMVYGEVLRMMHHREPLILYDVLEERGFVHRSKQLGPEEWEVRIWRKS